MSTKQKAFFFDVDKTITTTDRLVTPATKEALKKLANFGYSLAVAGGRSWISLKSDGILDLFPESAVHITNAGAQLIKSDGSVVWQQSVDATIVQQLVDFAQNEHLSLILKNERTLYCSKKAIPYYGSLEEKNPGSVFPISANLPSVYNIVIRVTQDHHKQYLRNLPGLHVVELINFDDPLFEITAQGISKLSGIQKWCELFGVDIQDTVAVGDNDNDIEMMQGAGFSVAVGNATPEIKEVADIVIGHTDEDGLALYLEGVVATGKL